MAKRARLDLLLVERGFFETRSKAQAAVMAGLVLVDGKPAGKAGDAVPVDAPMSRQTRPSVSISNASRAARNLRPPRET